MNLLFSCIGKRGYIARFFRPHLQPGDQIVGTSNTRWTAGFLACDIARLLPNIDSEQYPDAVLQLCDEHQIRGVLSFFDPDVVRLAGMRERFIEKGITPLFPTPDVAAICFDKYRTFQFLEEHGFQTPASHVDFDSARQAIDAGTLSYPLIVKPRSGFGSRSTFVAKNELQLETFFHYEPGMLIQEMLVGDTYDFDIFSDMQGRPVSVVTWRKLRSTMGETEHVITCKNDELTDLGIRLAECLKNVGPMDVDLFVNESGVYVLEMNPRFGGGYPASHLAGADFPELCLKLIKGETIESQIGNYREDVVMIKSQEISGGPSADFWCESMKLLQNCND